MTLVSGLAPHARGLRRNNANMMMVTSSRFIALISR
jgi:hypothetical protein